MEIFGFDEGAVLLQSGGGWQSITKGLYQPIEDFFTEPVKAGCVREYYLMVRAADNIPGCGSTQLRFWFSWASKPGHILDIGSDWGNLNEGSYRFVKIPSVTQQANLAGTNGNKYWRLDGRISGCTGPFTKIYGIYLLAIDRTGGTEAGVNLSTDPAVAGEGLYLMGGISNPIAIKSDKVGIGTFNPQATLAVNGDIQTRKVKVTEAAANWPDYVFDEGYALPSLRDVNKYVKGPFAHCG